MHDWQIHHFHTIDSTMNVAKSMIEQGLKPNAKHIIKAQQQNHGRGRFNRQWVSFPGNLLCSLLLQPQMPLQQWPQISFVTSLALYASLSSMITAVAINLKWPNDVMVDGKKIAGILLEIHTDAQQRSWLVIGLGVNIVCAPTEDQINQSASCLIACQIGDHVASYRADHVLEVFIENYDRLSSILHKQGFDIIRQRWLQHAIGLNTIVTVTSNNNKLTGRFIDIDKKGRMMIQQHDQQIMFVSSGDVV